MAERKIQHNKEAGSGSPSGRSISHLPRGDSRKIHGDDGRRNRFKDRGKDLDSAPNFFAASGDDNETSIKVGPKAPLPRNEEEAVTVGQGLGHNFAKKNFTHCQFCSELLWGQGFSCAGECLHLNLAPAQYPISNTSHIGLLLFCVCSMQLCGP